MISKKTLGLILGPLMFVLIFFFFNFEGLSSEGKSILASTIWIAIWWVTEAIPIAATSLLPLILFPLTGGLSIELTSASYGDKYIFLYLGGFLIAIAIEKWNLHKRIALNIILWVGSSLNRIILGCMIATASLSMFISNTATSVMMLPIAIAIVSQIKEGKKDNIFGKIIMLAIAYSASIGGVATIIGTPPNTILVGLIHNMYGYEIDFFEWFVFGFPVSIILLSLCYFYLTRVAYKSELSSYDIKIEKIRELKDKLGKISYEEKRVLIVFALTALCWILKKVLEIFIPFIDDTIIAIFFATLLFIIPSNKKGRLINWDDSVGVPWGILILFGGGLAIAKAFQESGLALWLGGQMESFEVLPFFFIILFTVAMINFLTEITSNLATTAMILPVLAPLSLGLNVHPFGLMVAAAVAASCAFMLPVATPPNAVVFGSGYLKISDMFNKGFLMNIISIIIITLMVYFMLPLIWEIDLNSYPTNL